MVWLSTLGYTSSCLPCLPGSLFPTTLPTQGISAFKERNQQKLRFLRALCSVSLQTGCRSLLQFPTVLPISLGSWGQACCLEAWTAKGWPRNRVRRPEGQSKTSLSNSHLGASSRGLVHPITAGASNGCQTSPDTHGALHRGFWRILQMSHKDTSRTRNEFFWYFNTWHMTGMCSLMQDAAGQIGSLHTSQWCCHRAFSGKAVFVSWRWKWIIASP